MRQFLSILRFEFLNYAKNKIFLGLTIAMVLIVGVLLSFPRITDFIDSTKDPTEIPASEKGIIALVDLSGAQAEAMLAYFTAVFPDREIKMTDADEESLKVDVASGTYDAAVVLLGPLEYRYIVNNVTMYDATQSKINIALQDKYRYESLSKLGVSPEQSVDIIGAKAESELISTGKNQRETFYYTYALIFMLYMAIMLYGQFVAMSVASEKSSRAMELLITSAKPINLMFGKVIGSGLAGLTQMVAILGAGFTFFNLNRSYWADNKTISSIFDMPLSILLYTILFFILGYFIYSFLYGALGSLASRTEDINTSIMPVTFVFVIAFVVVVMSMSMGQVDKPLMVACSFIPLTSPMAMFVRIAMGNVATYEIVISVVILLASTVGVGYLSAGIYRLGVLLYGKPPKLGEVFKMLRQSSHK